MRLILELGDGESIPENLRGISIVIEEKGDGRIECTPELKNKPTDQDLAWLDSYLTRFKMSYYMMER